MTSRHHRCGVGSWSTQAGLAQYVCTRCGRVNHVTQSPWPAAQMNRGSEHRLGQVVRAYTDFGRHGPGTNRDDCEGTMHGTFRHQLVLTGLAIALLGILVLLSTQPDEAVRRQADLNLRQLRDIAAAIEREALNARNLQTDNDAQLQTLGADLHARVEAIGRDLARAVPGRRRRPCTRARRRRSRFQLDRFASPRTRRGRAADAQVRGTESIARRGSPTASRRFAAIRPSI